MMLSAKLFLMHAVLLVLLALSCAATQETSTKRNVLFIVVDDLRPSIGAYGHPLVKTPNLDRLASESLRFTNAYVQFAYCAPSRNSFMTGRNPMRTKCFNFLDHFRETDGQNWTSLPGHFLNNGYFTLGAGKTFHPGLPPNYDGNLSWTNPTEYPYVNKYGTGDQCHSQPYKPGHNYDTAWCAQPADKGLVFGDEITINQTLAHLELAKTQDKPFFIAAGFHRPHMPWAFPERFLDLYPSTLPPGPLHPYPPIGSPELAWHPCEDNAAVNTQYNVSLPMDVMQSLRKGYHGAISFTDDSIGQLLNALEESGMANNTAVVAFGDHGWQLGEHNEWCKMTTWELGTRIPLLIRAPWMPASKGQVTHKMVEAVDIFPTMADLVGLPPNPPDATPIDGRSQIALFSNPDTATPARQYAFSQFPRCWRADQGVGQPKGRCAASDMVDAADKQRRSSSSPTLRANSDPLHNLADMCDCHWVPKENIDFMGFAVRNESWRFIDWYVWNGTKLTGEWDKNVGVELYNHDGDYGTAADFDNYENTNQAKDPQYASVVTELRSVVQKYYQSFRG